MTVSGLLKIYDELPAFGALAEALGQHEPIPALLLPQGARPSIAARLYLEQRAPVLLLTGKVEKAAAWVQALEMYLPAGDVMRRLPEPTPLPYDRGPWGERCRHGRLEVFTRLMAGQHPQIPPPEQPPLIVASARAFLQKTLPQRRFVSATRVLRVGQMLDLDKLLRHWLDVGYEPTAVVERRGQFSQRGGILDIYPEAAPWPVRIELFGDEIDTLRYYDPATQRTLQLGEARQIERVVIPPGREALPVVAQAYADSLPDDLRPDEADNLPSWRDDIAALQSGRAFPNLEYYLPLLYPQAASLLDYLPDDSLVLVDDWPELETAVAELHQHADIIANEQTELPPHYPSPLHQWGKIRDELEWQQPVILGEGAEPAEGEPPFDLADAFDPGPRYGGQMRPLLTQLKSVQKEGERAVIVSRQAARLADLWHQEQKSQGASDLLPPLTPLESLPELPPPASLTFVQGALAEGFVLARRDTNEILLDLLTDAEIFGWKRPAPRRWRRKRPSAPETHFSDIQAGDYVVHLEYGISRFQGLVTRYIGGMEREYLLLEYANSDVLYVPVHHADRLNRWIGSDERPPKISRLGDKSWSKAKAKAQKAADELAGELLELYAARETIHGHAFSPDTEWQAELEASFPYRETEDQLRVIADVKENMEQPQPMDRLICGDVGY
ncbi:MAG TPA: hypothetical protein EYH05_04160, partial [Anaerolineae bacterium]|nr:hypothetical protein [Anaerolineae bacterium]